MRQCRAQGRRMRSRGKRSIRGNSQAFFFNPAVYVRQMSVELPVSQGFDRFFQAVRQVGHDSERVIGDKNAQGASAMIQYCLPNLCRMIMEKIFALAPMMSITDRHFRVFMRHIFPRSQLYTEMISTGSIIHGERLEALEFDPVEHPVGIQFGGSNPSELAYCSKLAQERGFDEINLNAGCPSDRVQNARFGACLMAEPELVANCIQEIKAITDLPVTVKTRIGIDRQDSYEFLADFISKTSNTGCKTFYIHARKAWLKGLSPRQNRSIPPLEYDKVYRIKQDFPHLRIVINGGIRSLNEIKSHLQYLDGVMIGREATKNPWFMKEINDCYFGESSSNRTNSREEAVRSYMEYIEEQLHRGVALKRMVRHLMGIYHGQQGARCWRRMLCGEGPVADAGLNLVESALKQIATMQSVQSA